LVQEPSLSPPPREMYFVPGKRGCMDLQSESAWEGLTSPLNAIPMLVSPGADPLPQVHHQ